MHDGKNRTGNERLELLGEMSVSEGLGGNWQGKMKGQGWPGRKIKADLEMNGFNVKLSYTLNGIN